MAKVICTKTSVGQYESQGVGTFTLGEAASKASLRKEGEGRIQVEVGGCWTKGTYLKGRTGVWISCEFLKEWTSGFRST